MAPSNQTETTTEAERITALVWRTFPRAQPGHRVCATVRQEGKAEPLLLLCTPNSLGALVQRVRAHCRLHIGARAPAAPQHSIVVLAADGSRLTSRSFADLLSRRASCALTHVEVRVCPRV